jgi:hypothetical protein
MDIDIDEMTEKQAKDKLKELVDALDELDGDDYFGTEGWRHFLGFED